MTIDLSFNCQQETTQEDEGKSLPFCMRKKKIFSSYIALLIALPLISLFFLYLEHITHIVFLEHVAAIPLEIMFGAIIVERFLASREKKGRLRQLMHMKSHIFRSHMRDIFISNFNALQSPQITFSQLATAELPELYKLRKDLDVLTYRSVEELETIALSYIEASGVFVTFMEWAMQHDFEGILEDMVFVLHFIQDVRMYKEIYPDKLFVEFAMSTPQGREKLRKMLSDAITKFLDYAIELKTERPRVYEELIGEYLIASEQKKFIGEVPDEMIMQTA